MKKIDQTKLDRRLRGYYRSFRGEFQLLQNKTLTIEEYTLWKLSFSVLADWDADPSHADIFGSFSHSFTEVAYYLGRNPSFVSRRSKKLFELGLWKKREDERIEVCGFGLVKQLTKMSHKHIVNMQDYIANPHVYDAYVQNPHANLQEHTSKDIGELPPQIDANLHEQRDKDSLVSYKDESNVSLVKVVEIKGKVRSNEEYQKMFEEGGSNQLSPDDMRWIDENVSETLDVTDDNEKSLVETYFDGNWDEYKKHVFTRKKRQYDY